MRHDHVLDNLSAYIEDTLDPAMRAAVENHLRDCADCYRECITLRSVFDTLEMPELLMEPPPQFRANVMRRIRVERHEAQRAPAGLVGRFRWGWAAGLAGAAAVLVGALSVGPLQDGQPASFIFTPRWTQTRATTPAPRPAPDLVVGSDGTPAMAGQEYHLNLDFVARHGGTWKLTVQTSPGIRLLNTTATGPDGLYTIWEGRLDQGDRSGLTLMLQPATSGSVEELMVRFSNPGAGYAVERMVFVPVQTGGTASRAVDWNANAAVSLRVALENLAQHYGTPVAAPANLLDRPAPLQLRAAPAGSAVEALATGQGLRFNLYNDTYNLFP